MRDSLQLRAPIKGFDDEAVLDLIAKSFDNYFATYDGLQADYFPNTHYDFSTSRIGFASDTLATHLGVFDYQTRIGQCNLRTAGVGAVATHKDFRGKGFQAKTLHACLNAMHENGYAFSLLFGIPNFYHKFGYAPAYPNIKAICPVRHLPEAAFSHTLKQATAKHPPAFDRIFHNTYATTTGTAVRPTFPCAKCTDFKRYQWQSAKGTVRGYVVVKVNPGAPHQLQCIEVAGPATESVQVLRILARRNHCHELHFETVPPRAPVMPLLRAVGCTETVTHFRSAGAMARIIDLTACLEGIEGELQARINASRFDRWQGTLAIHDTLNNAHAAIHADRGRLMVVGGTPTGKQRNTLKGGSHLARLLLGSDEPETVMIQGQLKATGDGAALARILFPAQQPMLPKLDCF